MKRILILTEAGDFHAVAVAEALARKGADATLWVTSDFPTRAEETVHFTSRGREIRVAGPELDLIEPKFDVVWRRRPSYVLDSASLHPADRAFADSECALFQRSLLQLLVPDAFWVNPSAGSARAGSKLLQHQAAVEVGLCTPETLFTNSPREIRAFLRRHGRVVYKSLSPAVWRSEDADWLAYTAVVCEESLVADDLLRLTPGIFQEIVPKAYELRITMFGRRAFAARVLSQQTAKGRLDWRRAYDELRLERTQLPRDLEELCHALLDKLGLVFGCFDFVVTPSGEPVFLEVNEMGQFLFVERYCGVPLLDAFSSFLSQGGVDFEWSEEGVSVHYGDGEFEAAASARASALLAAHVAVPEAVTPED